MNKLNILFVSEYFWPKIAGGEVWSWHLCKELVKKGHKVTVLTSQGTNKKEETCDGVHILRVGKTGPSLRTRRHWQKRFAHSLDALLKNHSFDIIHAMSYGTNVPASQLAKKHGIPCITSVHSFMGSSWKKLRSWPTNAVYQFIEQRIIKKDQSALIQTPSKYIQEKLLRETRKNSIIIPNFITRPVKTKVSAKVTRAIKTIRKSNAKQVLAVGSLISVKNFPLAMNAAVAAGASLWIVGEGPEKKKLQEKKLRGIRFLGSVSSFEVRELMKEVDAVIVSSHTESFSLVALEAVAAGADVVGTPVGILPELVDRKHLGFSAEELAQAIKNVKRCKKDLSRYDKNRIIKDVENMYAQLVR